MLHCFQPGGGGYGDPLARRISHVLEDVREGLVSIEGAERDYGVVLLEDPTTGDLGVDVSGTRALREGHPEGPEFPELEGGNEAS